MSTHVPTHGALSESLPSKSNTTHDRKGREGKGIGSAEVSSPSCLSGCVPKPINSLYREGQTLALEEIR